MPVIAQTRGALIPLSGRGPLLDQLQQAGLPVASSCSGRGTCCKCVVAVLEGAEALNLPEADERRVLERNGAAPDQRLACRCEVVDRSATVRCTTGYW